MTCKRGQDIKVTVEIPTWVEHPIVLFVLLYRRLRYGYAFRRIPLTQGKFAIVDPEDYGHLAKFKWHVCKSGNTFYARRKVAHKKNKKTIIYMHRQTIKAPEGFVADHINHNGLDNRKANLRRATWTQNIRHSKKTRNKFQSNYKGLFHRRDGMWRVLITVNGRRIYLGCFKDEIEAAKAYDTAAKKYFGEFAALNFPD
jgi:hypothetical protein